MNTANEIAYEDGDKVKLKETGEEGNILDHAHEPGWVHVEIKGYVCYLREEGVERIE